MSKPNMVKWMRGKYPSPVNSGLGHKLLAIHTCLDRFSKTSLVDKRLTNGWRLLGDMTYFGHDIVGARPLLTDEKSLTSPFPDRLNSTPVNVNCQPIVGQPIVNLAHYTDYTMVKTKRKMSNCTKSHKHIFLRQVTLIGFESVL